MGRSGWGVAYALRALMSPPFWWNCCNMPQHHRDATQAACQAASRAGNQRVDHVACLDEGDVVPLGRGEDVGHWADQRTSIDTTCPTTHRSFTPSPYSRTHARAAKQPARPARPVDGPPIGNRAAAGLPGRLRPAPRRRRPDCGRGGPLPVAATRTPRGQALRGKAVGGRGNGLPGSAVVAPHGGC